MRQRKKIEQGERDNERDREKDRGKTLKQSHTNWDRECKYNKLIKSKDIITSRQRQGYGVESEVSVSCYSHGAPTPGFTPKKAARPWSLFKPSQSRKNLHRDLFYLFKDEKEGLKRTWDRIL